MKFLTRPATKEGKIQWQLGLYLSCWQLERLGLHKLFPPVEKWHKSDFGRLLRLLRSVKAVKLRSVQISRSILHGYKLILTSLLEKNGNIYLLTSKEFGPFFAGYLADWQWYVQVHFGLDMARFPRLKQASFWLWVVKISITWGLPRMVGEFSLVLSGTSRLNPLKEMRLLYPLVMSK